jgi:hypothetical protein
MNRRTQGGLLVGGLIVATVVGLAVGRARGLDDKLCGMAISCEFKWSWSTYTQWRPITKGATSGQVTTETSQSRSDRNYLSGYVDATAWVVTRRCVQEESALWGRACTATSVGAAGPAASDDLEVELSKTTGLPLPKRRIVTTAKKSPFITSLHVETPVDLAAVLGFYRAELSKRGWTESNGAVVAPDRAVIAFTTTDGPALLRLVHQDDRTIADLALRKPAAEKSDILPSPGRVKLMFGNATDEEAVITINGQTIKLAARAGGNLTDAGRKLPDSPGVDLPPGKYTLTFEVASGAAQNREFEVAANETWGLLVGPAGVPLPVHLY